MREVRLVDLKGAKLSALMALAGLGVEASMKMLVEATGYSEKSLRVALTELLALGLIARPDYRQWMIAALGRDLVRQFLFGAVDNSAVSVDNSVSKSTDSVDKSEEAGPVSAEEEVRNGKNGSEAVNIPVSGGNNYRFKPPLYDDGSDRDRGELVSRLSEDLGFDDAENWLASAETDLNLVWEWIRWWDGLPQAKRRSFRNFAGFMRGRVARGVRPARRRRHKRTRPNLRNQIPAHLRGIVES